MKINFLNIVLISILLLMGFQVNAQTYNKIIPIEDRTPTLEKDGIYFKDVNHIFDKYKGTWEGSLNGKMYKIALKKTTTEVNAIARIKKDNLLLRYKITKNGKEIVNTLSLPNDDGLVNPGIKIYKKTNYTDYTFVYSGEDFICGQSGRLLLRTTKDPKKIKLKLYPEGGIILEEDCPNGEAEQVFPTEEWLVLKKK